MKWIYLSCFLVAALPLPKTCPPAFAGEDATIEGLQLDVADTLIDRNYLGVDGQLALEIRLTEASRIAFGEFTSNHTGKQTRLLAGDTVLAEPRIVEPILGGAVVITGGFTAADIERLAAQVKQSGKITVRLVK